MAFPTTVNMALTDALRATSEQKAVELIGQVKLIKDICSYISGEPTITARRLHDLQGSLFDHKDFITSQSLVTAGSRTAIADAYVRYANAAAVTTDIQAANAAFGNLTAEIESVLGPIRAARQFIDNDPTTGQRVEYVIPEADLTALRALASTVLASLG